jgi:hypothetical protein
MRPIRQTAICVVAHTTTQVEVGLPCRTVDITVIYMLGAIDNPIGCNQRDRPLGIPANSKTEVSPKLISGRCDA